MKYPKRFEIEGINPETLWVKVVVLDKNDHFKEQFYKNIKLVKLRPDFKELVGPFADKLNNEWCIRFESKAAYNQLSV